MDAYVVAFLLCISCILLAFLLSVSSLVSISSDPSRLFSAPVWQFCRTMIRTRCIAPVCSGARSLNHNRSSDLVLGSIRHRRLVSITGTQYPALLCPLTKIHCWGPLLWPVFDRLVSKKFPVLESASCLGRCRWLIRPRKLDLIHWRADAWAAATELKRP